ncbi:hypothetical protein EYM_00725 [Ignicoccus islandicus DSM 13165]|uniref:tRNAHis guanylyltransferase catalytic domain-containing protein n=1 Tax=Ignicoccus islandicus DSM 13165 TaxID=940295 RepID=A0A0U3FHN0_9CREN|nr:tRNA(His) guanylyltransferase Thg1 family protein [Ignicoccus islandicus]ALU11414.1 hypothetical protein EYM_00725 [Ignicoccus islandicus DSM 13165]
MREILNAIMNLSYEEFKDREEFSLLRVDREIVVRMDGVKFGRFTKEFGSVRDPTVHNALVSSTKALIQTYSCDEAYVSSDEINVFCKRPPFAGRIEKIDSVFPSFVSANFSLEIGKAAWFDSRIVLIRETEWPKYVAWRLKVTLCNYASKLTNLPCHEALTTIEPDEYAFGTLIKREKYLKRAVNPLTGEVVTVERRKLKAITGWALLGELKNVVGNPG